MRNPLLRRYVLKLESPHHAIVALGLFIGLCYFPSWIQFWWYQIDGIASGSAILAFCLVYLAVLKLWHSRQDLLNIHPLEADRWIGQCIVIVGILLFPFCRFSLWFQSLLWLLILSGIAMSAWGMSFFQKYSTVSWAIALSAYPNPGHFIRTLWEILLPPEGLESLMAWATSIILRWLGHSVLISGPFILFPDHTIKIGWGCNGFDMVLAMIGASLLVGHYFDFTKIRVLQLSIVGAALALLVNVPRLVLMSIAAVYWGKDWFDFWHGSLGGQVFVVLLFIAYYGCLRCVQPREKELT